MDIKLNSESSELSWDEIPFSIDDYWQTFATHVLAFIFVLSGKIFQFLFKKKSPIFVIFLYLSQQFPDPFYLFIYPTSWSLSLYSSFKEAKKKDQNQNKTNK